MEIKAVLFDLGNTLLYFNGAWPEVLAAADRKLAAALSEAGLDLDKEAFSADFRARLMDYHTQREVDYIEHSTAVILKNVLADHGHPGVDSGILEEALKELYAASQEFWIPEEDLLPMMETLKADGYRLGIISNAGDDTDVQTLVDKADIRACLDFVLTSAASGVRKPDARIFELALQFLGLEADEVAMVGDTLDADILGANQMGITSVWIKRRADTPANRANVDTIRPDAEIETLAELPELLKGLG